MSAPDKTTNYDQLVNELRNELVSEGSDMQNAFIDETALVTENSHSKVQQNILAATKELAQTPLVDLSPDTNKPDHKGRARKQSWLFRLGALFTARASVVVLAVVICIGLVGSQFGFYSLSPEQRPTAALAVDEADLTFEDLWLNEDALLFSGEI